MTNEDFESWKNWSATQEIFKHLKRKQQAALEKMLDYGFSNRPEEVALNAVRNTGIVAGISEILELEYEELAEDIRKGEK